MTSSHPKTAVTLDWSHPRHWSFETQPCRFCNRPTRLRLDFGHNTPHMHKTCAENYLLTHPEELERFL